MRWMSTVIALLVSASLLWSAETSQPAPLAAKSLLLDVARAGGKLVAVGDRGHVLVSSDEGVTWVQSPAPTRAMLTGVSFADEFHGWAVGHDGVIIATLDGGRTWNRQDGGTDLDTVFLDVYFLDANRGFAVGAYGRFVATNDGGRTWSDRKVDAADLHLNRIMSGPGGWLYLAGETGTLLVSTDVGETWTPREIAYRGSLFALVAVDGDAVIVAGLRGRIFISQDHGENWAERSSEIKVLITAGVSLPNGVVVLAGQGGNFFLSRNSGASFEHWQPHDFGTSISELIALDQTTLLSVGEAGAIRHTLPDHP